MSGWRDWLQASRPLAQANLAAPLVLGQALAYATTDRFSALTCALVAAWGVLDQLFIVWSNDYADREDDQGGAHKTPFSGGSGVLPEGRLRPEALRRAAGAVYLALGGLSVVLALRSGVALLGLYAAAGLLMQAYSFPPLRLSYRGGGELLQGLGVGVVLPLVGFVAQAKELGSFPVASLGATFVLGVAGNVATALPDHASDSRAHKRSVPVRIGLAHGAYASVALTVTAIYAALAAAHELRGAPLLAFAVVPLLATPRSSAGIRRAVLRVVFLQGASAQLLLLGWSFLLVR